MRTTEEILARLTEIEGVDFFGFQRGDLIEFLPFDAAKRFLKDEVTAADWKQKPQTAEAAIAEIREYMPFAWDKANNCRGISAMRSVEHMKAWLWLAGDTVCDRLDDIYEFYGKPCLAAVCEKYGIDWRALDDGEWRNDESGPAQAAPSSVLVPA